MNKYFVSFLLIVTVVLLYFLAPVLTPFLVGTLLAYLFNPVVNMLTSLRFPRWLAVVTVFLVLVLIIALIIFLLVPLIQLQLSHLANAIPLVIAWLQNTVLPFLNEHFGVSGVVDVPTLQKHITENWARAGGVVSWLLTTILHSGFTLVSWLVHLVLIPVVTFYLLYDWNKVVSNVRSMIPRRYEPTIVALVSECDAVLSSFFRGQLMVMVSLGLYYSVGLSIIGLTTGLMIGLSVGLLCIIPYLGVIVGIISATIAAYVQFGDLKHVFMVLLLFAVGQALEGMFLTPRLVGHRIGLHPVAVIFSVLAGGKLFGFFGVLLALPVASVIMVMIRFLNRYYRSSPLYR